MQSTEREQKAPARSMAARLRVAAVALISVVGAGFGASACLNRPLCDKDCRPRTTNIFVQTITQKTVDKIDLLFMIDNSISMADKQAVLKDAVPDLVKRLVSPNCVDPNGVRQPTTPADPAALCNSGFNREFTPIKNIHVGVVTSSLGGHGSEDACNPKTIASPLAAEEADDHGYLIAKRPRFGAELGKPDYAGAQPAEAAGFLDWNPTTHANQDVNAFNTTFQAMVTASSEFGCGYEAQLEAVYRFLVDPAPFASILTQPCTSGGTNLCAFPQGLDQEVLAERAAFLRPDSLVSVIMVTDENDCSIQDTQQAYYAARGEILIPRASAACAANPNDKCCVPCTTPADRLPAGCQADPTCAAQPTVPRDLDPANLRCFNQKRRFGIDFLYPTQRYVNALSQSQLCTSRTDLAYDANNPGSCGDANADGKPDVFTNPLFDDLTKKGGLPREKTLVFLAGIVGVPWQDLQATVDKDGKAYPPADQELHYKIASQIKSESLWGKILGDPAPANSLPPVAPTNNLMLESVDPRGGTDGQGAALAPPNSPALANPVNSHEYGNKTRDDLMYSCVFKLKDPRDCLKVAALDPQPGCDCKKVPEDNNPLCQNPQSGQYETNQYFAKAYPGLRELTVLRDFGDNSIVASICARNLQDNNRQDYGYRPAVDAIVDRLKEALSNKCLPRELKRDATSGNIPCSIIEVRPQGATCDAARNRTLASGDVTDPVLQQLRAQKVCDQPGGPSCGQFVLCALGEAGEDCHHPGDQKQAGWCYVDPSQTDGKTEAQIKDETSLVQKCPPTQQRIINFVDPENRTPEPDSKVLIACFGSDLADDSKPAVTVTPLPDGG